MFDHSRDIETAMLFGRRHEATGDNGKPERFMGGLREFIPGSVLPADWTLGNLLDQVSTVFDWDSMAGDQRMVFCGNGALNEFNKKLEQQSGTPSESTTTAETQCTVLTSGGILYRRGCLLYTSPSPRDRTRSRMPSSA